jgi:hypothetical protein
MYGRTQNTSRPVGWVQVHGYTRRSFSRVITRELRQHLLTPESPSSFCYFSLKRISCSFKHRNVSLYWAKPSITNNCSLYRTNSSGVKNRPVNYRPSWFTNDSPVRDLAAARALLHVREALTSPRTTQQPLRAPTASHSNQRIVSTQIYTGCGSFIAGNLAKLSREVTGS